MLTLHGPSSVPSGPSSFLCRTLSAHWQRALSGRPSHCSPAAGVTAAPAPHLPHAACMLAAAGKASHLTLRRKPPALPVLEIKKRGPSDDK